MTGNLLNSGNVRGLILVAGGTSFQLSINPPSSSRHMPEFKQYNRG